MNDTASKSRERAERAFDKTRVVSMANDRIQSEQDAVAMARAEKTQRLKTLRLAEETARAVERAAQPVRKSRSRTT